MLKKYLILQFGLVLFGIMHFSCSQAPKDIDPNTVIPTPRQVEYQKMEFIGFIHFTVNTFTDKEWGYGDESPEIFHPTDFDADQWARVARSVGMRQLIFILRCRSRYSMDRQ